MKTETLYRQLLAEQCEREARDLYARECDDLAPWDAQPDDVRDIYRTRVKVIPLFAS